MDDEISSVFVFCNFRNPKHEEGDVEWLEKAVKDLEKALGGNRKNVESRLDKVLQPIVSKAPTKKSNPGNKKNKNKKQNWATKTYA